MHEMTVQSKTIVGAFYNRPPRLSYYQGCSTGGRQGMMEAQRYPDDFDAIVAGAPVYNMVHLNVSQTALQVHMLKNPERIVPPNKVTLSRTPQPPRATRTTASRTTSSTTRVRASSIPARSPARLAMRPTA